MRNEYSLSDIAAATNGANGFGDGNGAWWIILFLIFGWGRNGFGGGYGNGVNDYGWEFGGWTNLSNNVKRIDYSAFSNTGITNIAIPSSVEKIDDCAFFTEIAISNDLKEIVVDNELKITTWSILFNNSGLNFSRIIAFTFSVISSLLSVFL